MSAELGEGGFSPRLAAGLGGLAMALFALALVFTGGGDADTENTSGANSYSRSAIGHRALFETLAKLGRNVVRADVDPLGKLGDRGVLVLIEPTSAANDPTLATKIRAAQRVLLVLPKTFAAPDPEHPGWVRDAFVLPNSEPEASLLLVEPKVRVAVNAKPKPSTINVFNPAPTVAQDAQSVTSDQFKVLLGDKDGFVVGERVVGGRRIVVLADPDPIENLGILQGDNAAFALALFDFVGGPNDKFVFDETIHGFTAKASTQSPLRRLLAFPGNLLAALGLAALALLIGATVGRFGPPLPAPRERETGKRALIDNIASLMDFGGRHAFALRRYVEGEIRETAQGLRAPAGANFAATLRWLDKAAKERGVPRSASELIDSARRAGPGEVKALFALAAAAHAFKKEMLHEPG